MKIDKIKVSCITPSVRPKTLEIVANSLSKQTFKDFDWLICGPEKNRKLVKEVIGNIFPYKYLGNPHLKKGMFWDLNYSYNKLIKDSSGELLISWQDSIYAKPDAIQRFWDRYLETDKKVLIASSGHQYARLNKYGKPEIQIWEDCRRNLVGSSFYEIYPCDFEWNFGAVSKKALLEVGGFCEELDYSGFGMDGYQVNERLDLIGWKFYIDHDIESFTLRHDRSSYGDEDNWNKNNNLHNGGYKRVKEKLKKEGNWPIIYK